MRRLAICIAATCLCACEPVGLPERPSMGYHPTTAETRALEALRREVGSDTQIHYILSGTRADVVCGYAGKPPPLTRADRMNMTIFVFDGQGLTTTRDPDFFTARSRSCPTLAVAP